MALLWIDGFETYGTSNGSAPSPTDIMGRSYTITSESSVDIDAGRIGSTHCVEPNSSTIMTPALTTNGTLIIGFAAKFSSTYYLDVDLLDDSTLGVNIRINAGVVTVNRGTTLLGSGTFDMAIGAWYWFELKVLCNNSTGTYEVKVGETTIVSATSQDTKAGTHDYHNKVRFDPSGGSVYIDDFYVADGSGTSNNDFIGNVKVQTIRPDGAGNSSEFTPSTGSNYSCVDETIIDDDTTYVEDTTGKDTYSYGNTTSDTTGIKGIQVNTNCKETDVTSYDIITVTRRGSTDYDSSADTIGSTNYVNKRSVQDVDPSTSVAWTKTNIDAAEFGIKVG